MRQVMSKAVAIKAPTFFSSNTNLFQDSASAISFGFTGVGVSPCAIAVNPVGIGIGATVSSAAPLSRAHAVSSLLESIWLHWRALTAVACLADERAAVSPKKTHSLVRLHAHCTTPSVVSADVKANVPQRSTRSTAHAAQ